MFQLSAGTDRRPTAGSLVQLRASHVWRLHDSVADVRKMMAISRERRIFRVSLLCPCEALV